MKLKRKMLQKQKKIINYFETEKNRKSISFLWAALICYNNSTSEDDKELNK